MSTNVSPSGPKATAKHEELKKSLRNPLRCSNYTQQQNLLIAR